MNKKTVLIAALVTGVAAPAAYAGGFTCPKMAQQIVTAQEAEPTSMDMHFSTAVSTREITMNFMETLITRASTTLRASCMPRRLKRRKCPPSGLSRPDQMGADPGGAGSRGLPVL